MSCYLYQIKLPGLRGREERTIKLWYILGSEGDESEDRSNVLREVLTTLWGPALQPRWVLKMSKPSNEGSPRDDRRLKKGSGKCCGGTLFLPLPGVRRGVPHGTGSRDNWKLTRRKQAGQDQRSEELHILCHPSVRNHRGAKLSAPSPAPACSLSPFPAPVGFSALSPSLSDPWAATQVIDVRVWLLQSKTSGWQRGNFGQSKNLSHFDSVCLCDFCVCWL